MESPPHAMSLLSWLIILTSQPAQRRLGKKVNGTPELGIRLLCFRLLPYQQQQILGTRY